MRHAMIDIETLGVEPGCIVLSIGVVVFDRKEILHDFQVFIDPADSEREGLRAEAGTCMWWLDQAKAAQEALTAKEAVPLHQALIALNNAIEWSKIDHVWCNGASFDFPILKALHTKVGMNTPWKYYTEMDFRTFKNLFNKADFKAYKVEPAIAHDGLEDARAQAKTLQAMLSAVEIGDIQWAA